MQNRDIVENKIEKIKLPQVCPKCNNTDITKNGFRKLKNETKRQRYNCKQCDYKFILGENGFSKVSSDPKIISESLNLVMNGMSYRAISRHIESTHQIKISHVSINRWIQKYTKLISEYVNSLNPELSEVWSLR